jgi:hypothetical protein
MSALSSCLVMTPLVTPHALDRMADATQLNKVDHVLLEWWLAYTLYKVPGYPVYRITPIFCGSIEEDVDGRPCIGSLFSEFDIMTLPDKVNEPTQARLNRFLRENLNLSVTAPSMTVRQLVKELMTFNAPGCLCWNVYQENFASHGGDGSVSDSSLQDTTRLQVEVQRVYAKCANAIIGVISEAASEYESNKKNAIKTLKRRATRARASVQELPPLVAQAGPVCPEAPRQAAASAAAPEPTASAATSVNDWSVADVIAWLRSIGCEEFADTFAEEEVTGKDLLKLTDKELKEWMGMRKMYIRRYREALRSLTSNSQA